MRVLQIINGLGVGGAEKLILDLVPKLLEKGMQIDVLLMKRVESPFQMKIENMDGVNIFILGSSYYNPLNIFKIVPYLRKYDLIHVHLFPSLYFTALAKLLSGVKVPLVFTEHSTGNSRLKSKFFRRLDMFIYKYYQRIFCITEQVKEVLIDKLKINPSKLTVVENGIDIVEIQKSSKASRNIFNFSNNDILLIMVAGFREQKDHETVIKALNILDSKYKLILVGDGVRRPEVEKLIHNSQLEDRITLLGLRSDVYSLIKMADISILSSHWEGFGLAAAESMACERPVIASNVPGLADVVRNGGILFERGNPNELAEKVKLLESQKFYDEIASSGYNKSKQYDMNFMVEKIMTQYLKLYA